MRLLLFGANGTLGSSLRRVFAEHDIEALTSRDVDLTAIETIAPSILSRTPDIIINAAAYNNVDGAESHAALAMTINGTAVGEMARAASRLKIPIVHFSTDYVFDGVREDGYAESDAPNPKSAYARSKQKGEELVQTECERHILIRTSRLYGLQGSASESKPSFVNIMLKLAKERERIEVVDEERSSPTYADDLAEATKSLVDQNHFGLFHRTNDGSCTWFEFAKEIFTEIHWRGTLIPVTSERIQRLAQRPLYSILRTTKVPPLRHWKNALHSYLTGIDAIL